MEHFFSPRDLISTLTYTSIQSEKGIPAVKLLISNQISLIINYIEIEGQEIPRDTLKKPLSLSNFGYPFSNQPILHGCLKTNCPLKATQLIWVAWGPRINNNIYTGTLVQQQNKQTFVKKRFQNSLPERREPENLIVKRDEVTFKSFRNNFRVLLE